MSDIGQTERATQNRVITLFRDELGYDYLGNWQDRPNNSNIEDRHLTNYLTKQGYNPAQIVKTLYELRIAADNPNRNLYDNNKAVYSLLRYGVQVKTSAGENTETVRIIAKWTLENNPNARIVIITDRDELDKQIEGVFTEAGETIHRCNGGRDLMTQLGQATPRLLCSLVHKFGRRDIQDFDKFIADLAKQPSPTVGEIFVFVDECHRTQSGKLHQTMKALMPNSVFIGFTGTPLLNQDKATSLETFGKYIHTYKFSEAVTDAVVLDLVYEARDIDQKLGSEDRVDAWFDAKTSGLNDWQKAALREQWGTMQKVLSSRFSF